MKRNAARGLLVAVIGLGIFACKITSSKLEDSPGALDQPKYLRVKFDNVTYDHLLTRTKFEMPNKPWAITGERFMDKGPAHRYQIHMEMGDVDRTDSAMLSEYLKLLNDALKAASTADLGNRWRPTAPLSPGEKYDLITNGKSFADLLANQDLESIMEEASTYDKEMAEGLKRAEKSQFKEYASNNAKSEQARAIANNLSAAGKWEYLKQNFPMMSDGWSTYAYFASGAGDYSSRAEAMTFDGPNGKVELRDWNWMGICEGKAAAGTYQVAPRQAVLVKSGSKEIMLFESDIRHLWAKAWANQAANAPSNERLSIGGRCNLKAKDTVREATTGRYLDGYYCTGAGQRDQTKCRVSSSKQWAGNLKPISSAANINGKEKQIYVFSFNDFQQKEGLKYEPTGSGKKFAVVLKPVSYGFDFLYLGSDEDSALLNGRFDRNDSNYIFYNDTIILDNEKQLQKFLSKPDVSDYLVTKMIQTNCRPVNPATVHIAFSEFFNDGDKGRPFLIDHTPDLAVWNHPISGYTTKIYPLTDWVTKEDKEKDIFRDKRARGTRYLANVETTFSYIVSPEAPIAVVYNKIDPATGKINPGVSENTSTLKYSLEFNAKKQLIGGEYTDIKPDFDPAQQPVQFDGAPDFMWGFFQQNEKLPYTTAPLFSLSKKFVRSSNPDKLSFNITALRKIDACAQIEDQNLIKKATYNHPRTHTDEEIRYTECNL